MPATAQDDRIEVEFADEDDGTGDGIDAAPVAASEPEPAPEPVSEPEPVVDSAPVAEAPPETPPTETADDGFSAELLSRASYYNISAEEAKSFGSEAALERAFAMWDRQQAELVRNQLWAQPEAQPQQETPPPQQQAAPPAAPATQQQAVIEKLNLDLDLFDEDTKKTFDALNNHYYDQINRQATERAALEQQLQSLTAHVSQFTGHTQAEAQARREHEMETFFASLGDDYAELFGKGSIYNLPPDSPQRTNRVRLAQEKAALEYAEQIYNRPRSASDALLKRALASQFPDKIQSLARKDIQSKVQARRSQAISRAGGTQPKPRTPEQAAEQFVNRFMLERGEQDEDLYDGI